jgi:hypothetical protein
MFQMPECSMQLYLDFELLYEISIKKEVQKQVNKGAKKWQKCETFPSLNAFLSAPNHRVIMLSRPGPVPMYCTLIPTKFSMNSTYARASFGRS